MFTKENIQTTRGLQSSKWDEHYKEFVNGGDTLRAPLDKMSGQEASQFAARMRVLEARLGGTRKFHSGVCKVTNTSFVRVRPDGELPTKEEEREETSTTEDNE